MHACTLLLPKLRLNGARAKIMTHEHTLTITDVRDADSRRQLKTTYLIENKRCARDVDTEVCAWLSHVLISDQEDTGVIASLAKQ